MTAYLVFLDGPPPRAGSVQLITGVALATAAALAALGTLELAIAPGLRWVLAGAVAAPLAMWLASPARSTAGGEPPGHGEPHPESGDG